MSDRKLDPESLRALARRDWGRLARHKASYWAVRRAEVGVAAAFAAAEALRARMRAIDPTWPDAEQRRQDYAHHVAVAELFRRAHARAGQR